MGMAGNFITIYLHLMECLECKSLIAHGALREFQKKNFNSACIFFLNTAFQCFHAGIGYGSTRVTKFITFVTGKVKD